MVQQRETVGAVVEPTAPSSLSSTLFSSALPRDNGRRRGRRGRGEEEEGEERGASTTAPVAPSLLSDPLLLQVRIPVQPRLVEVQERLPLGDRQPFGPHRGLDALAHRT